MLTLNLIAQQLPDAVILRDVLNIMLALVLGTLGIMVGIKKLREKPPLPPEKPAPIPQPLIHQRHPEYVPRHEFTDLKLHVDRVESRIESVHRDLIKAGEERAVKLHERLNDLIEPLAEIRGRVHALTDHMKTQPASKRTS